MKIVKYNENYFKDFLDTFIQFWKERLYNVENTELIKFNLINKIKKSDYLYLLILNSQIIWFIWWDVKTSENIFSKNRNYWYINYLYVKEIYNGNWYATILKNFLLEEFLQNSVKSIFLNVNLKNHKAISIYKKWWFKENKINFKLKNSW